ncbi:rhomboid family intramembrane serine protease [Candidatus Bathyarchaeota archaeon]|nr:MAG: rhomboid family intramembrane serine protease [Candidatus Bathyarchaeota archaeon]
MIPLRDENKPLRKPILNYTLIAANVTIFFYLFLTGNLRRGIELYGAIPALILRGNRFWTIFTSIFIHADIMHLLGNMLYLWVFGDNVEDTLGHGRYLIFYISGGLVATFMHIFSTLLSIFLAPFPIPYFFFNLATPMVGASGAISAVLGAYLLLFPGARIRTLVFCLYFVTVISVPAFFYLGFWFLYQLLMGFFSLTGLPSTVAFWAHIGGFLFGMLIVESFNISRPKRAVSKGRRPLIAPWTRTPLVDLLVEDDVVRIYAFMPGVEMKDIEISVSEWEVVISAQRGSLRYYGRVALPIPVIPKVKDFLYTNGTLIFTLRRAVQGYI